MPRGGFFPDRRDPMADMGRGGQVMADEQIADPQRLLQALQLIYEPRLVAHLGNDAEIADRERWANPTVP